MNELQLFTAFKRNPALAVLWVIRENGPLDYQAIFKIFEDSGPFGSLHLANLDESIDRLKEAGLIQINNQIIENTPKRMMEVASSVARIQAILEISLTELTFSTHSLLASPVFGIPRAYSTFPEVFVMMPFEEDLKPLYDDHIVSVTKQLNISCIRGDDFFSTDRIINEIWSSIYNAKICIADCTGRNPNVFYEIGIAHTLGKPTILIAQSMEDIPFDISHRRIIIYKYTPRDIKNFEESLIKTLENERDIWGF